MCYYSKWRRKATFDNMNKELLHKYFTGETTPEEEKMIMDWAEESPENYQSYLQDRKWWNAVLVNYKFKSKVHSSKKKIKTNFWKVATFAASIALLIAVARIISPTEPAPINSRWQSVWSPPGQRLRVTLDDGTIVWLNSQSTLSFPAYFNANERVVELNGEGYFEVKKNKDIPFIVRTAEYDVEVLGTTFNVFAYQSQDLFETSLLEGSVRIKSIGSDIPEITLKPYEKAIGTAGSLKLGKIQQLDHFRWKDGLICLDDERFEDLLKKFSLYFDIKITVNNKKLLDYRCTGKFRHNDGIDYALRVLQTDMKFSYIHDNELNEIIIQ